MTINLLYLSKINAMPAILKQRNFFITKKFQITGNSLKVTVKRPFNYTEDEFTFEEIIPKTNLKINTSLLTVVPSVFFFLGTIITTISYLSHDKDASSTADIITYAVLTVLFFIYAGLRRERTINLMLVDRRSLAFYQHSPKQAYVLAFIAQIKKEQKTYLLNRYARPDPFVSPEQMASNLNWLFDKEIIDTKELERLRNSLLFKPADLTVGFHFNQN
ncbi:hypothetical protein A0256_18825 [Mucilaginibacter sp. PAMC 26640]|nr:hypothetical protein A0256_18825 [Mucilaginibacter sp. PAMC 26640]